MQQTRISIGSITTLDCESAILWAIDGVGAHSLRQLWQSLSRARRSSLRGRRFVSPCSVLACHCQRPRVLSASSVGSIDLHFWRRSALELTKLMTAYRKSGAEITRRNEARCPGLNDPGHIWSPAPGPGETRPAIRWRSRRRYGCPRVAALRAAGLEHAFSLRALCRWARQLSWPPAENFKTST